MGFSIRSGIKASKFQMEATIVARNKKYRFEKSKDKTMLIDFYNSEVMIHHEFVPSGQTVTAPHYLGALRRLLHCIFRTQPEYRGEGSMCLSHDNVLSHPSTRIPYFWQKYAYHRSITPHIFIIWPRTTFICSENFIWSWRVCAVLTFWPFERRVPTFSEPYRPKTWSHLWKSC